MFHVKLLPQWYQSDEQKNMHELCDMYKRKHLNAKTTIAERHLRSFLLTQSEKSMENNQPKSI